MTDTAKPIAHEWNQLVERANMIDEYQFVYNCTGLTPRQLLKQYNDLAQRASFLCADLLDRHQEGGEAWDKMQDFFAEAALAKHREAV